MRVKAFDWFLNDTAEVLRITESGAYKKTNETEVLGSLDCDIQPYSGKLALEEYGYNAECDKKMYYYKLLGMNIGGNTEAQINKGRKVDVAINNGVPDEKNMRKRDLLFFRGQDSSRTDV